MPKTYKYRTSFTYNGKRYIVRADTEKELAVKKAFKLRDLEENAVTVESSMSVRDWIAICIDTYKTNQKEITRKKYEARVRHCITERIGNLKLKAVKPIDCQQCLNAQAGRSKTQINEVYQALKFIFGKAQENGLIQANPAARIVRPSYKVNHRRALTEEEQAVVMDVAVTDRRYYLFLFMLLCGCRPSEAAGVRVSDITEKDGVCLLHIRGTKTANADRVVPFPGVLFDLVKDFPADAYIAVNKNGKPFVPDKRQELWRSFKRQINIRLGAAMYRNKLLEHLFADDVSPYSLRHTYCTNLAKAGVDIRTAQKLMGHSDISLTASIYTHIDDTDIIKAATIMEKRYLK